MIFIFLKTSYKIQKNHITISIIPHTPLYNTNHVRSFLVCVNMKGYQKSLNINEQINNLTLCANKKEYYIFYRKLNIDKLFHYVDNKYITIKKNINLSGKVRLIICELLKSIDR